MAHVRRSIVAALAVVAPTVAAIAAGHSVAFAATTPSNATQNFCSQVRASQQAITSATGTTAAKNKRIGIEWGKIEKVAPATVKAQVTLVKNAYNKAAGQADAAAKTTLSGIAAPGQKISSFVASNCAASNGGDRGGPGGDDGGRGFDPAQFQKLADCMKKEGVSVPTPGQGGERPNFDDPKFQAAAQKCGFGGPGGPGRGRGRLSDAARKCVTDKGITLPTPGQRGGAGGPGGGQGAQGGSGGGQGAQGGQGGGDGGPGAGGALFDDKTREIIRACREANPA